MSLAFLSTPLIVVAWPGTGALFADEAAPLARMLEPSSVFMATTFIVIALYGLFEAPMRDEVSSRPRAMAWLRRSFAAAFMVLGAALPVTQR